MASNKPNSLFTFFCLISAAQLKRAQHLGTKKGPNYFISDLPFFRLFFSIVCPCRSASRRRRPLPLHPHRPSAALSHHGAAASGRPCCCSAAYPSTSPLLLFPPSNLRCRGLSEPDHPASAAPLGRRASTVGPLPIGRRSTAHRPLVHRLCRRPYPRSAAALPLALPLPLSLHHSLYFSFHFRSEPT